MNGGATCSWQADITYESDGQRMEAAIPVSTERKDPDAAEEEALKSARDLGYENPTVRDVTLLGEG